MNVSHILSTKSVSDIVTVLPNMAVVEVAKVLADKGIGTVIVSQDGSRPDGILSERDIVRAFARNGAECLAQTAADLMTSKLVTCTGDDEADGVMEKMTEGRFRHMPVLSDGTLVGVISLGDVVKARLTEVKREKDAMAEMIMGH